MTRYTIVIEPLPDASDPQGVRRLRRLLKAMLRAFRLRCVKVERQEHKQCDT